ncbi:hypothetical protein [Pseudomonas sp. FEN]|uniref:hypothetical protein n=1 Tax=Pseudomonas sp. FEN TaxID=2767468 RepID=UPI0017482C47|nr:hypothetical protein [Pseudomonas sp. FEN]
MNDDSSLPASDVIDPLSSSEQQAPNFEREPQPERRAFNDLVIEVLGQRSVIGADIGVNKAALDLYYPEGLLCYLHPYLDQKEGDFVELFCGDPDDPVAFTTVSKEEADKGAKIPLFISYAHLPEQLIQPLFFRLTRYTGGNPEFTPLYSLLVDITPPAGPYDPVPSTPWHEEFAPPLPPQFVIDYGVDKDTAERGVPFTIDPYPLDEGAPQSWRMAEYDKIRLYIGGVLVTPVHTVTWDEANNRRPLTITAYYETWLKVPDGQKVVEYQAIDQCGNYSVKWSPQTVLKVNIGNDSRPRLPYAYIDESDLGEVFDTLDYDRLGEDKDATIVVTQVRQGYQIDDALRITLEGRTADGAPVREVIDYPIPDDQIGRNSDIPLRNQVVRDLVGGTAVLSYERIRSGSAPQPSEVTRLAIIGSTLSLLARPQVLEAIGDFLDPASLLATVQITPYMGQRSSDRVDLYLLGTRANDDLKFWHFFKMAGSDTEPVLFYLQHDRDLDIAGLNGGTLDVHYLVTNAEGERKSQHAVLNVGEATATLPAPDVPEAPGGVLDPESSTRGATVVVPRTANLQEGDLLNVYWQGSKPGGNFIHRDFEVTRAWLDSDIPFPIERQYVDANKGGSVKAFYIVKRGRDPVQYSHTFNLTVGIDLALEKPEVLETTEPRGNVLNPLNVQTAVTVRVRYEMENADSIQPYWKGATDSGTPAITPKPGNAAQGYVDFTLSGATAVGPNLGKTVNVNYEVTRSGATKPSNVLDLMIQTIAEADLPTPRVFADSVEVLGDELDITKSIMIRVDAWPFFAHRQHLEIKLEGTNASGGSHNTTLVSFSNYVNSQESVQRFVYRGPIPATYLNQLGNGTTLRVLFKAAVNGGTNIGDALAFPTRTLTVTNEVKPVITGVHTSTGASVPHNGTTDQRSLTLSGTATPNSTIEVRDGTTVVLSTSVNGSRAWSGDINNLSEKKYNLVAKIVGGTLSSDTRSFTVQAAEVKPVITGVHTSTGASVPHNGTTDQRSLTLSGTATPNSTIEVRDGTTLVLSTSVNVSRAWSGDINNLSEKKYNLVAKIVGGTLSSDTRSFTVRAAEVKPVITGVHTSTGASVPHNGTTDQRSLTLTGTATPNSTIEVRDGTTLVLSTSVNVSRAWSGHINNLSEKKYNLVAKIVGGTLSSDTRIFTVRATVTPPAPPTITALYDHKMNVCPNGGTSSSLFFGRYEGRGAYGQRVVLTVNGNNHIPAITVGTDGSWSYGMTFDGIGLPKYTVIASYVDYPQIQSQPYIVHSTAKA